MSFVIFTKNKEGVRAIRAIEYEKYVAGKYTRARAPLARKCTNRIFESKNWHNKYENGELDWKTNFFSMTCFISLYFSTIGLGKRLTKSNRTEIQTHKVEERTFRTPCTPSVKSTWGVSFQRTEDSRSAFSPFYSKGWKRYRGGGWVVIKFLVWIFLRPYFFRVNWRARIFFHFIFPCANIFFVLRPPPAPATHKFSNGPFVSFILQWTV